LLLSLLFWSIVVSINQPIRSLYHSNNLPSSCLCLSIERSSNVPLLFVDQWIHSLSIVHLLVFVYWLNVPLRLIRWPIDQMTLSINRDQPISLFIDWLNVFVVFVERRVFVDQNVYVCCSFVNQSNVPSLFGNRLINRISLLSNLSTINRAPSLSIDWIWLCALSIDRCVFVDQ
jgi:hypothetical protein